jgi:threonyl-tRNA synthetase
MIHVKLPDGSVHEYADGSRPIDVAEKIGPRLAKAVVAAQVNGQIVDLGRPLEANGPLELKLLTPKDPEALGVLRHSTAHVMARAVMRLHKGVQLAFGPTVENGFYYDFDLPEPIREEDFPRIEEEMRKIINDAEPFERFELPVDEAREFCRDLDQALKVEHIDDELKQYPTLSFYRQGEFVDLCRGPHIPDAGRVGAFKLLSVAGAYWKNDASRKQLQRLYGTAWFTEKDLNEYLEQLEEAKRRDHRVLGKQLKLFAVSPLVGSGMILWMPKGATVRSILESFIKEELVRLGYSPVYTPHIGRVELYEQSGHYPYYADSQFAPIEMENGERYLLKPMNCPHHIQIYKAEPRSYRDLPVRLAEFGTVYRYEQSGELNGMLRVRGLTQDDAHQFCTPEQVEDEFRATLDLVLFVLKSVGLSDYRVRLGLRDPESDKYVGSDENWDRAEASLRRVLEASGLPFEPAKGEAAFYGPKADFLVTDCIGRQWQLGTVQLDYNLPERFELEYAGPDNRPHRPVMIHRAPFGSMERFVGVLIEHFAGAFPLWLAPEQVRVIPVGQKFDEYARKVETEFRAAGFRVTGDYRSEKMQARIRDAQIERIPYMLVVGGKDQAAGTVSVRDRVDGDLGPLPIAEAIEKFRKEVADRTVRQVSRATAGLSTDHVEHAY